MDALIKNMNVDEFAKSLLEIRKDKPRKGRRPAILNKTWEELTKVQKEMLKDDIRDVIEALTKCGCRISLERQQPVLRTAKKRNGKFL